jgi:hypothetical protein
MRFLLDHGKPLPEMTLMVLDPGTNRRPFGTLCQTERHRLIYWPPLPKDVHALSQNGKSRVIDHITLEPFDLQSHSTSFDDVGKRHHHSNGWMLHNYDDSGLSYWFSVLLRWSLLEDQENAVEAWVRSPNSDATRRIDEFKKFVAKQVQQNIPVSPRSAIGDYVHCMFFLAGTPTKDWSTVISQAFTSADLSGNVDGFDRSIPYEIRPVEFVVGESHIMLVTACPPGNLTDELIFGFPRKMARVS